MSADDRRRITAALVERTGVRLDENDPALVLVELNRIMLENSASAAAAQIEDAAKLFNNTATAQADAFVGLANETLAKFSARANEIKTLLGGQKKPPTSIQVAKRQPNATWLLVAFLSGLAVGVGLSLIV